MRYGTGSLTDGCSSGGTNTGTTGLKACMLKHFRNYALHNYTWTNMKSTKCNCGVERNWNVKSSSGPMLRAKISRDHEAPVSSLIGLALSNACVHWIWSYEIGTKREFNILNLQSHPC
jgi:hypothetical protein